jgi:hypothetical protein
MTEGGHAELAPPRQDDLPRPRLVPVFRLDADLAAPLDLGPLPSGRRRIVALTAGTVTGSAVNGTLLPGSSADWQTVLDVRSHSIRHGSAAVLARLGRGEEVDPGEYVFRAATHIETTADALGWMNKGVFVTVGARRPGGVTYETYLVE